MAAGTRYLHFPTSRGHLQVERHEYSVSWVAKDMLRCIGGFRMATQRDDAYDHNPIHAARLSLNSFIPYHVCKTLSKAGHVSSWPPVHLPSLEGLDTLTIYAHPKASGGAALLPNVVRKGHRYDSTPLWYVVNRIDLPHRRWRSSAYVTTAWRHVCGRTMEPASTGSM